MKNFSCVTASVFVTTIMLTVTALPATAQLVGDRPCSVDMGKYCGSVTPGGGRLLKCFEEQKANMSRACVSWVEQLKVNAADLRDACSKDIEARCEGSKGDPFEMLKCLENNYVSLSDRCVKKLNLFKYYYPKPVKESGSGR